MAEPLPCEAGHSKRGSAGRACGPVQGKKSGRAEWPRMVFIVLLWFAPWRRPSACGLARAGRTAGSVARH